MKTVFEDVYVRCIILSILGWLLNVLKNVNEVRKDSIIANIAFSYRKYLNMEKITFIINGILQLMVMVYIHDIVTVTGQAWMATVFIGMCAYFGSEFITYAFGTAKKVIKNQIDQKTSVADNLTGQTDPTPLQR